MLDPFAIIPVCVNGFYYKGKTLEGRANKTIPDRSEATRQQHKNVNRVSKGRCLGTFITFCAIREEVRQHQRKKKGLRDG